MDRIVEALSEGQIVESNSLATVTRNWVVVPNSEQRAQTILSSALISGLKKTQTSYPGLLVIAAALSLLSAAAYTSKQGDVAVSITAVLALFVLGSYFLSRKAFVIFIAGNEPLATQGGRLSEAEAIIEAFWAAQSGVFQDNRAFQTTVAPVAVRHPKRAKTLQTKAA